MSIFSTLNAINVNGHTEKKDGLTYLPWAWAWAKLKENYPDSFYTIYKNANGIMYHTDGRTCWVETGVTVVDGDKKLEHIEYLPVMNHRNQAIALDQVTSVYVNKAIQRSLTKAVARHGLGLYVYAGEDLPDAADERTTTACASSVHLCDWCGSVIDSVLLHGKTVSKATILKRAADEFGAHYCFNCLQREVARKKEATTQTKKENEAC